LGHRTKWEYLRAIYERYHQASRKAKRVILNEFCANTGYHRKYAIRLLNGPRPGKKPPQPVRRRGQSYGHEVLSILTAVWEAAGYPWSVRLKALLPPWMPWVRKRFRVRPEIERQLLAISARQMDRRLKQKKGVLRRRLYGRTKPGTLLKHHIPVKTDCWDVHEPGFSEVDLVSHSGNCADGEFAHSLTLTDIHTTWTEPRAVLGRGQSGVLAALAEIAGTLPFPLRGVDSDNGSEFINWHLKRWCDQRQIQLTRGRPYKKDDNAHVEQKNWTHVRKLLGWERYDSREAVAAINDLYRNELRLWLNLYLPSVKLVEKVRVGSKLRRRYDAARTPLERVAASPQALPERVAEFRRLMKSLDPFELGRRIDRKLQGIYKLANRRLSPKKLTPASARVGEDGCGKAATWKSKKHFSTALGNPAKNAGFPLSHSRGGGGPTVTFQMSRR